MPNSDSMFPKVVFDKHDPLAPGVVRKNLTGVRFSILVNQVNNYCMGI
jgi:hypothetical protein